MPSTQIKLPPAEECKFVQRIRYTYKDPETRSTRREEVHLHTYQVNGNPEKQTERLKKFTKFAMSILQNRNIIYCELQFSCLRGRDKRGLRRNTYSAEYQINRKKLKEDGWTSRMERQWYNAEEIFTAPNGMDFNVHSLVGKGYAKRLPAKGYYHAVWDLKTGKLTPLDVNTEATSI